MKLNNKNNRYISVSVLLLVIFFGCVVKTEESLIVMNVFVHGTRPALRILDHKKSPARHIIHADTGLHLAKKLPKHYHLYQAAIGCHERNSLDYNIEHFYLYGWHSSNLRPEHRKKEGQKLFQAVDKQVKAYKAEYDKVIVRFIGSSHGGNVVLNAIACMPFNSDNVEIEVILLGTPVQKATQDFINNPYITRAFSFYSTADWIQRIDVQKFHKNSPKGTPLLSARKFNTTDKVVQIELKVNGKPISHGKYRSLFKYLPEMMRHVITCKAYKKGDKSLCLNFMK